MTGEYKEKYRDKNRRERGKRRSRSRCRDRKRHCRHRLRSFKGRKRSRSKSPKHKSSRRKPSLYWDVPASGYEHMTTVEYKAMLAAGPSLNNSISNIPSKIHPAGKTIVRQARRLFIGNIPFGVTEVEMIKYFNQQLYLSGIAESDSNPVLACKIYVGNNYAFLEFRSASETTKSMCLDGIQFKGNYLKIQRPHEYQTTIGVTKSNPMTLDMMKYDSSSFDFETIQDSGNKLFIGGLPRYLNEDQVIELLTSFGQLKTFNLVRDSVNYFSGDYAFCEYVDTAITDRVIDHLNGLLFEGKNIVVHRAYNGAKEAKVEQLLVPNQDSGLAVIGPPTEVLCLLNIITPNELKNDNEYEKILVDIREECNKYGSVRSLKIPRPIEGIDVPGCGKVFIEFHYFGDCEKTLQALTGRTFNNRTVLTSYMESEKYHRNEF
ncbi:splicing factor U2AF 50 kDa subunit-like [Rhopalosiphum padi]|uniref:splicing factor U2AF 50 kDa subunit-like n=1 Tax=Rhopalosiphum padi TaxID=40932 RepID=UPI00298D66EB|nr:splicing factor U2AF 50 kDa subunit-like [Rhopalosiphum padi]